jgi:NTP pyrophosphatase (non-canonical NTP hydrolase)
LFYGKQEALDVVDELDAPEFISPLKESFESSLRNAGFDYVNLLHGVVGIATESGELIDAFAQPVADGKPFDLVNISEEIGDVCWYQARVLETVKRTFDEVQVANIRKLQDKQSGRFKSGSFSSEEAIERDVVAERTNLENNLA